jgi:hypothetical protein
MSEIMTSVLEILIPVLASVLTALAAIAIRKLQARFDIELSQQQNNMMLGLVRNGIASAEEWAARELKVDGSRIVSGRDKAQRVIGVVKAMYPEVQESEIAMLIDAEIARTDDLGSTGKSVRV